ncbi:hypothetical protein WJX84_009335 [Apatococcus fuscideae]|uniref:Fungal lipase-type domain-containing protein n=1 Tax=Apatococcus fuscideae TaxID=2026836 RepID=A0AAW1T0K4_9CHLO
MAFCYSGAPDSYIRAAQEQAWKTAGPTYGLMNYAVVCQELSKRTYDSKDLQPGKDWFTISLPAPPVDLKLQDAPDSFKANLISAQLSRSAQLASDYLQYGIWYVSDMGYVVAFKGTTMTDGLDWLANCNIRLEALDYQGSIVKIHGGFYKRAAAAWMNIQDQLMADTRHQSRLPAHQGSDTRVWLTGHSLGGAYATALYIDQMTRQPPEGLDLRGLITFGAPLVLSEEFSEALACNTMGKQAVLRMHHFVNELDIVPRVLGKNISSAWLQSLLAQACPVIAQILSRIELQRAHFSPCGIYYLFLHGQLQTVHSADQPELLRYALDTLLQHLAKSLREGSLPGFVRHHNLQEYEHKLQEAFRGAYDSLRSKGHLSFTATSSTPTSGVSGAPRARLYLDEFCDIVWPAAGNPMWKVVGAFAKKPLLDYLLHETSDKNRVQQHFSSCKSPMERFLRGGSTARGQPLFSTVATSAVSGTASKALIGLSAVNLIAGIVNLGMSCMILYKLCKFQRQLVGLEHKMLEGFAAIQTDLNKISQTVQTGFREVADRLTKLEQGQAAMFQYLINKDQNEMIRLWMLAVDDHAYLQRRVQAMVESPSAERAGHQQGIEAAALQLRKHANKVHKSVLMALSGGQSYHRQLSQAQFSLMFLNPGSG